MGVCNYDCLNCIYDDCINNSDQLSISEILQAEKRDKEFSDNPESFLIERRRECRIKSYHRNKDKHVDKVRKYREKTKESKKELDRLYYENHKAEKSEKSMARYYSDHEKHKKENRERQQRYRENNREEVNRKQREYRARVKLLKSHL